MPRYLQAGKRRIVLCHDKGHSIKGAFLQAASLPALFLHSPAEPGLFKAKADKKPAVHKRTAGLAGTAGIEPARAESKSAVLPLDYVPI
jgi:hypothetical protein